MKDTFFYHHFPLAGCDWKTVEKAQNWKFIIYPLEQQKFFFSLNCYVLLCPISLYLGSEELNTESFVDRL